jgi:hypothetical protein
MITDGSFPERFDPGATQRIRIVPSSRRIDHRARMNYALSAGSIRDPEFERPLGSTFARDLVDAAPRNSDDPRISLDMSCE